MRRLRTRLQRCALEASPASPCGERLRFAKSQKSSLSPVFSRRAPARLAEGEAGEARRVATRGCAAPHTIVTPPSSAVRPTRGGAWCIDSSESMRQDALPSCPRSGRSSARACPTRPRSHPRSAAPRSRIRRRRRGPPPPQPEALAALEETVRRLRAELAATTDRGRHARLLHEIADLEERAGDEPGR